jgi:SH3 domain-containing YSC84-like protein 1
MLTYSRARGLFAGISLEGSTLRPDNRANEYVYGRKVSATDITREGAVAMPAAAQKLVSVLDKRSPRNSSDPNSLR